MKLATLIHGIHTDWKEIILQLTDDSERSIIEAQIHEDIAKGFEIYPPPEKIFAAFQCFNVRDLKVVILGQDPYQNEGEADGLCFSTHGKKMPPSLRNIFAELQNSIGVQRDNKVLLDWAEQGVLLLNRSLTVRQACPNSHKRLWHPFVERVIKWIAENTEHVVFLLWGNDARQCKAFVDPARHLVLEHTHPSPLSRSLFVGNKHFVLCNEYLAKHHKSQIQWV